MPTDVRDKILKSDTLNENLVDRAIRHQVFIQRYGTGLANRIVSELEKSEADLVRILTERLLTIQQRGFDTGPVTTRRLHRLQALIDETISLHNGAAYKQLTHELRDLARQEGAWQAGIATAEAPVAVEMLMPSASYLNAVVTSQPFRGKHLRTWFGDLTRRAKANIKASVTAGLIEGEGVEQIVRRIVGTRAQKYTDGILEATRTEARMVVRTAANHVSNAARAEVNKANEDIIKGEKIIATLDKRTSAICRVQDGRVYPVGKGARPPFHPNCRSTVVPVMKSWKELGINLKEAPKGTRAAMGGEVPEDVTYPEWFKKQSAGTQREILGKSRYDKFKSGDITDIERFSDRTGKLYTLPQLARVEDRRGAVRRAADLRAKKAAARRRAEEAKKGPPAASADESSWTTSNGQEIQQVGKDTSRKFKLEVQKTVEGFPPNVAKRVQANGGRIVIGDTVTTVKPELAGKRPRGWPEGHTWDEADGFFNPETKRIVVTERVLDYETQKLTKSNRVAGVIRHEYGHAVDKATRGPDVDFHSNGEKFMRAHEKDVLVLKKRQEVLRGLPDTRDTRTEFWEIENMEYYHSNLAGASASRQEAFAEGFAVLHGGGSSVGREKVFARLFPNTLEVTTDITKGIE